MARADSGHDHEHNHRRASSMFHGRELPLPIPTPSTLATRPGSHAYNSPFPPVQITPPPPNLQIHSYPSHPPPPFTSVPIVEYWHKVWVLDCKSCGRFLTNRAMKCVLMLRSDVHLFSSDALPANCSVYQADSQVSRTRTCECLTQSLACHGCGASIGYMIVAPCSRCMPSLSPNSPYPPPPMRNTNGHRFVFHASEVSYEERLYVPSAPDVVPDAHPLEQAFENIPSVPPEMANYLRNEGPYARPTRAHAMHFTPHGLPKVPKLRAGQLVYWHHLTRRGDLLNVQDDERSRASRGYGFDPKSPERGYRVAAGR